MLHIVLRIRGGGMGEGGGGPQRPGGINTTSSLEASRDDEDGSADLVKSVFIGAVKPTPQQDPNWYANMTEHDVNAQLQWQGDWDVLERRIGEPIVVFLNSTGRMDPKIDNGEANALSGLPYAVFLIESGVADIVAIADAQVDSAKWHNVNMYCEKRDVTGFYGPTSNAVSRMENIVSAQGTSSSTLGGTLLLMTNMVAGHMCRQCIAV